MLDLILSTVGQGLQWSVLALGVFLTFRILDIADLSVEGSFPLGAGRGRHRHHGGTRSARRLCSGARRGFARGRRHRPADDEAPHSRAARRHSDDDRPLFREPARDGKSNVGLLQNETVFTILENSLGLSVAMSGLVVGLVFAVAIAVVIYWFFGTELGTAVRATGFNPQMARAQGINTNTMVVLGLVISNGLVALSGGPPSLRPTASPDVGMAWARIVIGLASVIIGEVLFSPKTFKTSLAAVILGSIIYRLVIAFVLEMGMPPNDLKLFTAVLVAIALALPLIKEKMAGLRTRA